VIVVVAQDGALRLRAPEDLKRLHCELRIARAQLAPLPDTLRDRLAPDADGRHVWINIAWLRAEGSRVQPPDWSRQFDAMVASARPHGWVSEDGTALKAHIHDLTDISGTL
jgi:hypothetical protein